MPTVRTTTRAFTVQAVFQNIPEYISGRKSDTHRIGRIFWGTLTRFLFQKIYMAYAVKSEGGTDELGNRWPPLKRSTIASRPIHGKKLRQYKLTKKQSSGIALKERTRGLLTPAENRLWKLHFFKVFARLRVSLGDAQAKKIAAGYAWNRVKQAGARTKQDVLGARKELIMRVTDRIYDSLRPSGAGGFGYRPVKDQIYNQVGTQLEIGTMVEYASFHEATRPVIPLNMDQWIEQGISAAMEAVMNHIAREVLK